MPAPLILIPPAVEALLWALGIGAAAGTAGLAMSNAQQKANAKFKAAATTQACSTCPPPECKDNAEQREKLRNQLKKRAQEMREDKNNLFNDHYYEWQRHPTPGIGSWMGHVRQFQQKQKTIRDIIQIGETLGCPEPDDDSWHWATRPAPTQPGVY
ncbi:hypothetical protein [Rhizobium sp. FKY42]|uniref:hypothetical protein n=1 Tax=Rhizobium sp. FKY42 TaxID=2562310 RepID=UPI0010C07DA8|nr:hypothetical protein [Rhizobium sp. FKY42]